MHKVYLINKPIDFTSHDVVNKVRKKLNTREVGHTGTLDPFATGLLIILTNEATKLAKYLEGNKKTYQACLELGTKTDTGDCTGTVIDTRAVPSLENVESVLKSFLGDSYQIPPMYSAIKVDGMKLYELAREGINVDRKKRLITIYDMKLLSIDNNKINFEVTCSAGTYIRTLGEDIANKLGTVGHLDKLTRTRIGNYTIESAIEIDDIRDDNGLNIEEALDFEKVVVDEKTQKDIKNGIDLSLNSSSDYILLLSGNRIPLAIYKKVDNHYHCIRGFNICK